MWLNIISGRSYNDLSQYPIFPWTMVDQKLQRDLNKNMGCQGN